MSSAPAARGAPAGARSRLERVPTFKPAYLIHGDEHGRISERRARLRAIAEAESGSGGVEVFEGDAATPEAVGLALRSMTFAIGRRFLIVDGVERWKDADVEAALAPALADIAPDTTVAFFAREEGRTKVSAELAAAVNKAGGDVVAETALKPRELPRWVVAEGERLGIKLEGAAAKALVAQVGDRQQRLLRELEKLALEHGEGATIGVEEVEGGAALSAERQVWGLVDALVGRDRAHATRAFLELRAQGETLPRLIPLMARRIRDVLAIAARLEAGESPAQVKGSLKMSPWAADRRIKEARATDVEALQRALEELAELELASRGNSELAEDTAALRAIDVMVG
jgi:DNA polymerase-3 subunit delta